MQELTPVPTDGYVYDLAIGRAAGGSAVAAWVQWDGDAERICWRTIRDGILGDVQSTPAIELHPCDIRVAGGRLIWCEMSEGRGAACRGPSRQGRRAG